MVLTQSKMEEGVQVSFGSRAMQKNLQMHTPGGTHRPQNQTRSQTSTHRNTLWYKTATVGHPCTHRNTQTLMDADFGTSAQSEQTPQVFTLSQTQQHEKW